MTALASRITTVPATSAAPGVRRRALLAGVVAGPLFVTTAVVQILTRDGFDLNRHPLSLLANGPFGWVQSANFILAGLLSIVFAYGVAPQLAGGRGAVAGPVLLTAYGVGLVTGGVFKADPAMGFPAGAPAGYPEQISTSSIIHGFAPPLAFLALVAACLVLARRFAAEGYRVAAAVSVVVAVLCFLLPLPFGPLHSIRLFGAVILGFAWVTAFAVRLRSRG
jgi:Protein of unknown function (DUF998)